MVSQKRSATSNAESVAKHAKVDVETDPITKKLWIVTSALQNAGMPSNALDCLTEMLPNCLGVVSDERHRYQEEIVNLVDCELKRREAEMQSRIEEAQGALEKLQLEKSAREATATEAERDLNAKIEAVSACKYALAEEARAFGHAKVMIRESEQKQIAGCGEIEAAVAKRCAAESVLIRLETIHATPDNTQAFIEELQSHVELENAMAISLPAALSKESSARGGFDVMVVLQATEQMSIHITGLTKQIDNAEPARASFEADVKSAKAAFEEARERQLTSASAYTAATNEESVASNALEAAQNAVSQWGPQLKRANSALSSARAKLDKFVAGPMAVFVELRDRKMEEVGAADAAEDASPEAEAIPEPEQVTMEEEEPVAIAA